MKTTCSKLFGPYPFAHRQPTHDGHCKLIHGHDWKFLVVFEAIEPDVNGFVIDFGKMGFIKDFLTAMFDHTLVLPLNDPEQAVYSDLEVKGLANIKWLDEASAEGLAKYLFNALGEMVQRETGGRVWVTIVTVFEDEKNSATVTI